MEGSSDVVAERDSSVLKTIQESLLVLQKEVNKLKRRSCSRSRERSRQSEASGISSGSGADSDSDSGRSAQRSWKRPRKIYRSRSRHPRSRQPRSRRSPRLSWSKRSPRRRSPQPSGSRRSPDASSPLRRSSKGKSPLRSTNWEIWMDYPKLETMDYTKVVEFLDSDDEDTGFVEVSEQTRTLLETKRNTECAK